VAHSTAAAPVQAISVTPPALPLTADIAGVGVRVPLAIGPEHIGLLKLPTGGNPLSLLVLLGAEFPYPGIHPHHGADDEAKHRSNAPAISSGRPVRGRRHRDGGRPQSGRLCSQYAW
jgi:hypothetical protein